MKNSALLASVLFWASAAFVSNMPCLASEFKKVPDSAEYKGASWDNLVKIEKGLTLDQAYKMAKDIPEISYFFYTTHWEMVLHTPKGPKVFRKGDTAFFSGTPRWGSAVGLADGYKKISDVRRRNIAPLNGKSLP